MGRAFSVTVGTGFQNAVAVTVGTGFLWHRNTECLSLCCVPLLGLSARWGRCPGGRLPVPLESPWGRMPVPWEWVPPESPWTERSRIACSRRGVPVPKAQATVPS